MIPRISSAEWDVMNVIWEKGSATAAEVFASLPPDHGWATKTVNTFLARLVQKRALTVKKVGNVNVYTSRVAREEAVATEGDSFVQRIFKGAAGAMMLHFAERAELTPEEVRKLEALLKAKKRK